MPAAQKTNQNPSSHGNSPYDSQKHSYAVYHENRTAFQALGTQMGYESAYHVPSVRRRGWYGYKGDEHVIWDRFGYGDIAVADFLKLVRGDSVPVPASYGKRLACFKRIDVISSRSFAKLYQADCRTKPSLRKSLRGAFDVVVHHIDTDRGGIQSIAVRACDYPKANWASLEASLVQGHKLPDFVLCAGPIKAVLCYLDNDMLYDLRTGFNRWAQLRNITSMRWQVDIPHAVEWLRRIQRTQDNHQVLEQTVQAVLKHKESADSAHSRFRPDVMLNFTDVVEHVAEEIEDIRQRGKLPFEGSLVGGAPAPSPSSESPHVVMMLEFKTAVSWQSLGEACGADARPIPVFSDDDLRTAIHESVDLQVPVIRQGTLLKQLALSNKLQYKNTVAARHPSTLKIPCKSTDAANC